MYLRNPLAKALPFILLMACVLASTQALAEDWPEFRGRERDGRTTQGHLLRSWPADGPKLLWSADGLGKGYASIAVSKGTVYTTGMIDGEGYVFAYDLNGNPKWKKTYGPEWAGSYPGSRTTPTIDGDCLYVISAVGRVVCLNTADGEIKWTVNISERFGARNLRWGLAESPLIVDGKVICTPGGSEVALAALDKMTGQTVWTTKGLNERSAYCSPILIKHGQKQLIVTMLEKSIVLLDVANGDVVTRIPHSAQYDISAVSPLYDKGRLFVTNGYGKGSMMYELSPDATAYERKWTDKALDCHHGGVVLVNGHVYGISNKGTLVCLELASGQIKSRNAEVGKGSIIYADGMLYCYDEKQGNVRLVKPGIDSTDGVGSFQVSKGSGKHWAHPAIADGRLYVRHGDVLMAYDIRSPRGGWRNDATGRFPAASVPLEWSDQENVIWKTPLPDWSNASPILVNGRIFVCSEPTTLTCLDADTGKILWQRANHYFDTLTSEQRIAAEKSQQEHQAIKAELDPLEKELADLSLRLAGSPTDAWLIKEVAVQRKRVKDLKAKLENSPEYKAPATHGTNGYSSPTPTTDGEYVYVLFGTGVAACYDMEGNRQWCKFIEAPTHKRGHSASPLLADGKLIVQLLKLTALDCRTGQILWTAESDPRWGSPITVRLDDDQVIVTAGGSAVRASDGRVLAEKIADLVYSTPVYDDGIVYFIENGGKALEFPNTTAGEFKPTVLWTTKPKKDRYYASPIIYDGLIYAITRAGVFSAIDVGTGDVLYEEKLKLGGTTYPSIVLAGDNLLVSSDTGTTVAVRPGRTYQQIAKSKIEGFRSTPLPKGCRIYIRTFKHLYCLGSESSKLAVR